MKETTHDELLEAGAFLDVGMYVALATAAMTLKPKVLAEIFDQAITRLEQQEFESKVIDATRMRLNQLLTVAEDNQDGQNS